MSRSSIDDVLAEKRGNSDVVSMPLGNAQPINYEESIPESQEHNELPLETSHTEIAEELQGAQGAPSEESSSAQPTVEETDDYGNPRATSKTYTEDEVSEIVRKRLARFERAQGMQQPAQPQAQQQYQNPYTTQQTAPPGDLSDVDAFLEERLTTIQMKYVQQQETAQRQIEERAFEEKFINGAQRFNDFREIVVAQKVTDHMAQALKGIEDPSAFIYAASKRAPEELARISQMKEPYAQIVAMGKLEEKLKRSPNITSAPKPIERARGDVYTEQNTRQMNGDELLVMDEKRRRAQAQQRRR